jgi:hypothetical protein
MTQASPQIIRILVSTALLIKQNSQPDHRLAAKIEMWRSRGAASAKLSGGIEAELRLRALGVDACFAFRLLRGRLESPQTTDFVHDPFGVELAFEPFESTINRLSFANDDFWHVVNSLFF